MAETMEIVFGSASSILPSSPEISTISDSLQLKSTSTSFEEAPSETHSESSCSATVSFETLPFDVFVLLMAEFSNAELRPLLELNRQIHEMVSPFFHQSILTLDLECYPNQRGLLHNLTLVTDISIAIKAREAADSEKSVYPKFSLEKMDEIRIHPKPRWDRRPGKVARRKKMDLFWPKAANESSGHAAGYTRLFQQLRNSNPRIRFILPPQPAKISKNGKIHSELSRNCTEFAAYGTKGWLPMISVVPGMQCIWIKMVLQIKVLFGHFEKNALYYLGPPRVNKNRKVLVERVWCGVHMSTLLPSLPHGWPDFSTLLSLLCLRTDEETFIWAVDYSYTREGYIPTCQELNSVGCPWQWPNDFFMIRPLVGQRNDSEDANERFVVTTLLCHRRRSRTFPSHNVGKLMKAALVLDIPTSTSSRSEVKRLPKSLSHLRVLGPKLIWHTRWTPWRKNIDENLRVLTLENLDISPGTYTLLLTPRKQHNLTDQHDQMPVRLHTHHLASFFLHLSETVETLTLKNLRLLPPPTQSTRDPAQPEIYWKIRTSLPEDPQASHTPLGWLGCKGNCHAVRFRHCPEPPIAFHIHDSDPTLRKCSNPSTLPVSEAMYRPSWIRDVIQPVLFGTWARSVFFLDPIFHDGNALYATQYYVPTVTAEYKSIRNLRLENLQDYYHPKGSGGVDGDVVRTVERAMGDLDGTTEELDVLEMRAVTEAVKKVLVREFPMGRPFELRMPRMMTEEVEGREWDWGVVRRYLERLRGEVNAGAS